MAGGRFRSYLRAHLPHRSAAPNGNPPAAPDGNDAPFDYSLAPLPSAATHIRLLDLRPPPEPVDPSTPSDAPLQCRLYICPLAKLPAYLALSYTWGSGPATHPLRVVTEPGGSHVDPGAGAPLGITESLAEALRHLRTLAVGAFLWVDQVCIDQGNVAEKNAQVAAMGAIYAGAQMVCVWLGPAQDGLDLFAQRMGAVYRVARDEGVLDALRGDNPRMEEILNGWTWPDPQPEHRAALEVFAGKVAGAFFGEGCTDDEVMAVARARRAWLSRPWFSRAWVIQEFALAKRVFYICGMTGIEAGCVVIAHIALIAAGETVMDMMSRAGVDLREDAGGFEYRDQPFNSLIRIRKEWNKRDESAGDPLLLVVKRLYGEARPPIFATDARDRIFALLGLASDVDRLGIRVDYSDSTPADVVYTRAARAMIESTASGLSLFEMVRFPKSVANDKAAATRLPSWVPDFDQFRNPIAIPGAAWVYSPTGDAREPCFLPTPDDRILGLKGILVDHVLLVGEAWDNERLGVSKYHGYCLDIQRLLAADGPARAGGQPEDDINESTDDANNDDDRHSPNGNSHNNHNTNANTTAATEDHLTTAIRIMTGDLESYSNIHTHPLGAVQLASMRSLLELSSLLAGPAPPRGTPAGDRHRERVDELLNAPGTMRLGARLNAMAGRRPYRTRERGYVGMGPRGTRLGNVVVIFPGAQTPFVLRPSGERGVGYYELVGETYCHGVMDGERWGGELEDFFLV